MGSKSENFIMSIVRSASNSNLNKISHKQPLISILTNHIIQVYLRHSNQADADVIAEYPRLSLYSILAIIPSFGRPLIHNVACQSTPQTCRVQIPASAMSPACHS